MKMKKLVLIGLAAVVMTCCGKKEEGSTEKNAEEPIAEAEQAVEQESEIVVSEEDVSEEDVREVMPNAGVDVNDKNKDCNGRTPEDVINLFFNDYVRNGKVDKAMKLLLVDDMKDAKEYIEQTGIKRLNEKYSVAVAGWNLHPSGDKADVEVLVIDKEDGHISSWGSPIPLVKTAEGWKMTQLDF